LFADEKALNDVIADWHASIGKAILENWDFAEPMSRAVGRMTSRVRCRYFRPHRCGRRGITMVSYAPISPKLGQELQRQLLRCA